MNGQCSIVQGRTRWGRAADDGANGSCGLLCSRASKALINPDCRNLVSNLMDKARSRLIDQPQYNEQEDDEDYDKEQESGHAGFNLFGQFTGELATREDEADRSSKRRLGPPNTEFGKRGSDTGALEISS